MIGIAFFSWNCGFFCHVLFDGHGTEPSGTERNGTARIGTEPIATARNATDGNKPHPDAYLVSGYETKGGVAYPPRWRMPPNGTTDDNLK